MKLTNDFYSADTLTVARNLLGKVLVSQCADGVTKGIIVETEAYIGPEDLASHSYMGRRTERCEAMYHKYGCAYVYLIYGMYHCVNVVTGDENKGEAVLLRAVEPTENIELMKRRRRTDNIKNLTNGPGKLCMAFDIDMRHNKCDLCGDRLYMEDIGIRPEIVSSKRINIDYAGKWKDKPWRFTIRDNPFVSVKIKNPAF